MTQMWVFDEDKDARALMTPDELDDYRMHESLARRAERALAQALAEARRIRARVRAREKRRIKREGKL